MFLDSFSGPCCPPQSFRGALCKPAQLVQLQLLQLLLGAGTGWLLKPAYVAMLHQLPQPALTSWKPNASLTRGGTSSKRTLGALALAWKAPWFGKCCLLLLQEWNEGIFKGITGKIGRGHKMDTELNSTKEKNSFSVGKLTSFSKPGLVERAFWDSWMQGHSAGTKNVGHVLKTRDCVLESSGSERDLGVTVVSQLKRSSQNNVPRQLVWP